MNDWTDPADEYRRSLRQWVALWVGLGVLAVGIGIDTNDSVTIGYGAVSLGLAALAVRRWYRGRQKWRVE